MRSFPPNHADPREKLPVEAPDGYQSPPDDVLAAYVEAYWVEFRQAVERCFGDLAATLALYSRYPYESTVLRLGQGAVFAHKPAATASVRVLRIDDFSPSPEDWGIFTIQKRLEAPYVSFDFRFRTYGLEDAQEAATQVAFDQALGVFWRVLEPQRFEELCRDLLIAEKVVLQESPPADFGFDALGDVYLEEPGQFLRQETWGFEFKHYRHDRPSAQLVRASEARFSSLEANSMRCASSARVT